MKITHIHIERFRGFQNEDFEVGSLLTAIAGQNGTQKSTLLGIITQTFTLKTEDSMRVEKPLCGGSYISAFKDKFRLSPTFDKPKGHEWTISFDAGIDDFTVESIKRTEDPNVRFWKKGARQEGDGYISFPTIFLSLKRLVPVAEEAKIITDDTLLTQEELNEFKQLHNKILIAQTPISSATTITSKNKQSIGVSTELYDWNQNSMGQDNLGKIILALFSFKRLHDKYPRQYKGGILAIDEMDATMYPASQVELLKVLRKYASKLNLQILFTTHSMSLLKAMDDLVQEVTKKEETANQAKILYLKKVDDKIAIKQGVNFKGIQLDLNVVAEGNNRKYKKEMHGLTREAKNKLLKYAWPGNVRELQHTIERAVILGDGSMLKPENFLFHATPKQKKDEEMVLNLEQLERQAIEKALRISDGNISRAAEYLGITRFALYRKLEKLGL